MSRLGLLAACFLFAGLGLGSLPQTARADADEVTRATLDNGLRVVIVRNRLAPVVTTEVTYLAGSIDEPDGAPGLAHAQEHMMFRSSDGLSADQLAVVASGMGGNANGYTQQTVTQYIYTVPVEDLDVALHIEAIRMHGALDLDTEWSQERGAIEQEVAQRRSSALYRARAEALAKVFEGTPYAHDALGTALSFESIDGAALHNFYSLWYAPNNAILVIAGDVDPVRTLALVQQTFSSVPKVALPRHGDFRLSPLKSSTVTETSDLPFSMAFVAYRLPGVEDKDYAAGRILGDALSSERAVFYQLEPKGKALAAGFIYQALPKASVGVAFAAITKGDLKATADTLRSLAAAYANDGVPPELVEAAKRHEAEAAQAARGSIPGLAQLWSQTLAVERRNAPEEDLAAIAAVTPADVNRVAKQYFDTGAAVVAMLQQSKYPVPMAPQEGGGGETFSRNPTARVTVPSWARKVLSSLGPATSSVNPSDQRLPNGLRLIVQRESVSSTVFVVGEVKTNEYLQTPPGKEGLALMLDGLFSYGTTSLDQLAFLKALDDASATVRAGSKFTMRVPAQSFDQGIALLADNLQHPAFPESIFKRQQSEIVSFFSAGRRRGPSLQQTLMQHLYPPGDPMRRTPSEQSLRSLTIRDLQNYYHRAFRPDVTTIVVVGDIAPEQARAAVDKWFGGWKASGPRPRTELPPAPPNKGHREHYWYPGSVQDTVFAEETLGVSRSSPDYYAFQVGNYVFGHMSSTARLFQDLRIDKGLVYYVDGEPQFNGARSTYWLSYACDPQNLAATEDIVRRDFGLMQTDLVGQQELQQAKAMLEREIPLAESGEEEIATALVARAVEGVPLDEPRRAAQQYLRVSAQDIRGAFAKWLSADRMVELVRGPR